MHINSIKISGQLKNIGFYKYIRFDSKKILDIEPYNK